MGQTAPDRFTIALPIAERAGCIFLDYLRNQRSATSVMPRSLRARFGSPVAAPVTWAELDKVQQSADAFGLSDVAALLKRARSSKLKRWGQADQSLPQI